MTDDLISRQAAINYCHKLINVEHQQGSDEMNYGHERVNQTETILHHLELMPSAQPTYTDAEIQKMQDLEQAQIEKAYQLGREDAQPPWIPCSKKLPDESDAYLVTNCNCVCPVELAVFKADGAYWTDAYVGERYKNGYILAWMPLPKPYKPHEVE